MEHNYQSFFALLRTAMTGEPFEPVPSAQAWSELYEMAGQQSVMGVCFTAFSRLSKEQQPPMEILMQWIGEAETIRGMNELQNQEAARLTRLFSEQGRKTAILKGQANARLYPDSFSRQPGDIDIWVEGGRESVLALLQTEPFVALTDEKHKPISYHANLFVKNKTKVDVHFRPGSGNYNPFTNKRMERWLNAEILNIELVEEGFNVPSVKFALVMQLAHIQRHFLSDGIGLRQICDYYMLLKHSSEEDRWMVAAYLKGFGLRQMAGALMWVLGEVLQLDRALMLCEPDSYRGEWMLREIMAGGNFGKYVQRQHQGMWRRFFAGKLRHLRLMRFNFWEVFWGEVNFCKGVIQTLPERIRRRSISLGEANKRDAKKLASTKKIS